MNRSRHDKTELVTTQDKSVRQLIRQNQKHEIKYGLPEMSPDMAIQALRRYFKVFAQHGDECTCECCFGVEVLAKIISNEP